MATRDSSAITSRCRQTKICSIAHQPSAPQSTWTTRSRWNSRSNSSMRTECSVCIRGPHGSAPRTAWDWSWTKRRLHMKRGGQAEAAEV